MLKKQYYVAPEAEVLLMKYERNFMETDTGESYNPTTPSGGGFSPEP